MKATNMYPLYKYHLECHTPLANSIAHLSQIMPPSHLLTYGQRAARHSNPAAKLLLETMERKKSNLAVSVDVTSSSDFYRIVEVVGPYVCLVKATPSPALLILRSLNLDSRHTSISSRLLNLLSSKDSKLLAKNTTSWSSRIVNLPTLVNLHALRP